MFNFLGVSGQDSGLSFFRSQRSAFSCQLFRWNIFNFSGPEFLGLSTLYSTASFFAKACQFLRLGWICFPRLQDLEVFRCAAKSFIILWAPVRRRFRKKRSKRSDFFSFRNRDDDRSKNKARREAHRENWCVDVMMWWCDDVPMYKSLANRWHEQHPTTQAESWRL